MMPDWLNQFPELRGLTQTNSGTALLAAAKQVGFPAGSQIFHAGSLCEQYLLVQDGRIRVQQVSISGREILLYRIGAGESCILTTACLFNGHAYPAMGISETSVRAIVFPQDPFQKGIADCPIFRSFVFRAYGDRLTELFSLVEEVVFTRLDIRLARLLLHADVENGMINSTHHAIAAELGSAREVVSRTLRIFEERGWIQRQHRQILLLDLAALRRLANSS
ncbi:Crp/Fnr family transcriptional regulator [Acidithiobacillus sp. IBUN Pt1247-S3]|uniref:Crp/Fnr family transcriptional regulator n=1 Tax=Acidithiobacillus sp. IBUN Pt1247-S3 TaxID=3166642 RepID=UPI0034E4AE41